MNACKCFMTMILTLGKFRKESFRLCLFYGKKINKKWNLHVWPKGQDMCWYPLDKVVALTRSPGTKNYFMDMGKKWLS